MDAISKKSDFLHVENPEEAFEWRASALEGLTTLGLERDEAIS